MALYGDGAKHLTGTHFKSPVANFIFGSSVDAAPAFAQSLRQETHTKKGGFFRGSKTITVHAHTVTPRPVHFDGPRTTLATTDVAGLLDLHAPRRTGAMTLLSNHTNLASTQSTSHIVVQKQSTGPIVNCVSTSNTTRVTHHAVDTGAFVCEAHDGAFVQETTRALDEALPAPILPPLLEGTPVEGPLSEAEATGLALVCAPASSSSSSSSSAPVTSPGARALALGINEAVSSTPIRVPTYTPKGTSAIAAGSGALIEATILVLNAAGLTYIAHDVHEAYQRGGFEAAKDVLSQHAGLYLSTRGAYGVGVGAQRSLTLCEEAFASFGSKMAAFGRGEIALPNVMVKAESLLAKIESAMPRMRAPSAGRGTHAANQNALPAPTPRAQPASSSSSAAQAAEASSTSSARPLLDREGLVDTYGNLDRLSKKGDNLAAHHMPNDNYMRAHGVKRNEGIAMFVEHLTPGVGGRHREIHKELMRQDPSMSPRDALAQAVLRVREVYKKDGVYTSEIRQKIQDMIMKNKEKFPHLFESKKK